MTKRKPRPRRILGPKYRIFSAGKDTRLVVSAPNPEAAIKRARALYPTYQLGWPAPLTARLFRGKEGNPR